MLLKSKIESILFVSNKPLSLAKLADMVKDKKDKTQAALEELIAEYDQRQGGIMLMRDNNNYQMVTSSDNADLIKEFLKDESSGELTRPSLETLTIIAYRGPINKVDLEQIRGVNCSLILRNLMIRGLVEMTEDKKTSVPIYNISFDFLRYLGLSQVQDLPDYEKLHKNEVIDKVLSLEKEEDGQDKEQIAV